jgi:hypothetical protein
MYREEEEEEEEKEEEEEEETVYKYMCALTINDRRWNKVN